MQISAWLGRLLIAVGCGCLGAAAIDLVGAASFQRTAAQTFDRALATRLPLDAGHWSGVVPGLEGGLIGRLEIPRLGVSVIVMEGEDEATLTRAVGHLPGTAFPWEPGNVVLAGHRDTFFQPLKHLREGDAIWMTTARGTFHYRVIRTEIVEPEDVSALAPSPTPALTLVTCYPFVYVGLAPKRFIVHAR